MPTPQELRAAAERGGDRYPWALWKPLPENATQPRIQPRAFILHTQAGSGPASNINVWNWSARTDVTNEATFYLQMDGALMQAMSLFTRADSNYKANPWTLSVETQDNGAVPLSKLDQTPWSAEQMQVLAEICAFLNMHPQIRLPLQPVPTWDGAGVAPHNAFPNEWSKSAHSCPGRARTAQVPEVIARARAIVAVAMGRPDPNPTPPPQPTLEDDMAIVVFQSNSNPKEFNAMFFAETDGQGRAIEVQWSGNGNDPRVQERVRTMLANFPVLGVSLAGLKNCRLAYPHRAADLNAAGDAAHVWQDSDFAP